MTPPISPKRPISLVVLASWALIVGCAPPTVRPRPVEAPASTGPATSADASLLAGPQASTELDPTEPSIAGTGEVPAPPAPIAAVEGPAGVAKGPPSAASDAGREQEARSETAAADDDGFDIDLEEQPAGFPDPFERLNRRMFAFNRRLDAWVIAPVSRTYGFLVPRPAKAGVRNFLFNLASPVRLVNDVLQGQWSNAGNTAARFAINTVAGVGGIVDTAKAAGLPPHDADFGQTLAKKGVGSGPFLVVPVLGPTTVRDGFGAIVDTALNPATYLAPLLVVSPPLLSAGIGASASGLVEREHHDRDLRRLEEGSTDYYAALRSAYYQNRIAQIEAPAGSAPGAPPPATPSVAPLTPAEPRVEPTPGS